MKKKNILFGFLTGALALTALVSCGKKKGDGGKNTTSETTSETTPGEGDTSTSVSTSEDTSTTTTAAKVTLYIAPNYGSAPATNSKVDKNSNIDVPNCPFERDFYTFKGYSLTKNGEIEYELGDTLSVGNTNITLYCVWEVQEIDIVLHFDNTTYNFQTETVTKKYDETITLPDKDISGYGLEFKGWSKSVYIPTNPSGYTVDYFGGQVVSVADLPVDVDDNTVDLYGCYINPAAHVYDSGTVTLQPTLETDGVKRYSCTQTGHTDYYEETISKTSIFASYIEDAMTISGVGTVATTVIMQGTINKNDPIRIVKKDGTYIDTIVTGIELNKDGNRSQPDSATKGDAVGLLLRGVNKSDLDRGMLIVTPGKEITCEEISVVCHIYSSEEGGRRVPFFPDFKPDLVISYFSTQVNIDAIYDNNGDELEMAMPGNDYTLTMSVVDATKMPIWIGQEGILRSEGRTIGSFTIISRS